MIACRSRSVLASSRGSLERPACLLLFRTKFSTIAPPQQAATPAEIDPTAREPGARLPLALQAVYFQPFRRVATHGLPVCDLQLRSFSVRNLEFMCDFALRTAYYCHLPASGPVPLPKRTERWTVPKGHFVHKKSQENFERVTHKRLIQIKDGHPETVELWLAFLKKHQYYGVGMKANVWGFDELGVGKRMNVSLETLKDVPRPKWTHFGSRRTFETADKVREILASEGFKTLSAEPAQIDAALSQVTDKEAVRAKIKEILNSPKYRALAGESDEIPAQEKLVMEKFMTEEESVQMEALKIALAEEDNLKKMLVKTEPVVDTKPEESDTPVVEGIMEEVVTETKATEEITENKVSVEAGSAVDFKPAGELDTFVEEEITSEEVVEAKATEEITEDKVSVEAGSAVDFKPADELDTLVEEEITEEVVTEIKATEEITENKVSVEAGSAVDFKPADELDTLVEEEITEEVVTEIKATEEITENKVSVEAGSAVDFKPADELDTLVEEITSEEVVEAKATEEEDKFKVLAEAEVESVVDAKPREAVEGVTEEGVTEKRAMEEITGEGELEKVSAEAESAVDVKPGDELDTPVVEGITEEGATEKNATGEIKEIKEVADEDGKDEKKV